MPDHREVDSKEPNHLREDSKLSNLVQKEIISIEHKFDNYDHKNHLQIQQLYQNMTILDANLSRSFPQHF